MPAVWPHSAMLKWLRQLTLRAGRCQHETVVVAPRLWVSRAVLKRTIEVLQRSGTVAETHEGVAYWAGRWFSVGSIITTCIAPAAKTTSNSFETSSYTNARAVAYLAGADLELLGQVHSHPASSVGHSHGDDERALMPYEGFLSIVVPHYGQHGMTPLTGCGVHVFESGRFRRMGGTEVESSFRLIDVFTDLRT